MRRFFKGGWASDTCARLALRLFVRPTVSPDVIPALPTARGVIRSSGYRSNGRHLRRLKLPHRKHNKIIEGKLIYGGY